MRPCNLVCKPSYRPGIVAAADRREVLDEDHPHTSRSSVTVVNIAVKHINLEKKMIRLYWPKNL